MQLKRWENIIMVTLTYKNLSEIESTCVSFFFSFFHFHEHKVLQATLRKTPPKTKTKKSEKQNKTNYGRRFNYSVLAPK